ncbi:MAG TPA: FkbM family methyltransferase [Candidatus Eisenbacteria bacterium]
MNADSMSEPESHAPAGRSALGTWALRILPSGARVALRGMRDGAARRHLKLAWMRWRIDLASQRPRRARFEGYTVRIRDGASFYMAYKDIFVRRIYHFESPRPDPRVLDCGSNIGISILYFKRVYPSARVTAFEADPAIFAELEETMRANRLTDVRLVHAALGATPGMATLYSDESVGSFVSEADGPPPPGWSRHQVAQVRLSDHLAEPVDFLKMNIEGAEWEVLSECGERLRQVREMVIEYHHLPRLPRTLHRILELLDGLGFQYLINDFDAETNGGVVPPFHLDPESRYFLLIYARRVA